MNIDEIKIENGINIYQNASIERNEKTIEYTTSRNLAYEDVIGLYNGLNAISEFYDVNAAVASNYLGLCGVSLGKNTQEALLHVLDCNPIEFINAVIILSKEVDSDIAKMLKGTNIVAAPSFTKNAVEYLDSHDICYIEIKTPLKDYKKYLQNTTVQTPLGTLTQTPNYSELEKDTFKTVTKAKPTVEQIEDAVFAWKVAKNVKSHAIVIAKDLKTTAISQGLLSSSVEFALDYSCDRSKEAILASDICITLHDFNVAAQGRISLIIVPSASKEIITAADKNNIAVITTGFTNILV